MGYNFNIGDKVKFKTIINSQIPRYYTEADNIPEELLSHGSAALHHDYHKEFAEVVNYYGGYCIVKYKDINKKFTILGFKEESLELVSIKPNFIVGKWYKNPSKDISNTYAKFVKWEKDFWYYSEVIKDGKFLNIYNCWFYKNGSSVYTPTPLEDIQEYLPDKHPDKYQKINYKYDTGDIVKVVNYGYGCTVEDMGKIVTITKRTSFRNRAGYLTNPELGVLELNNGGIGEDSFELIETDDRNKNFANFAVICSNQEEWNFVGKILMDRYNTIQLDNFKDCNNPCIIYHSDDKSQIGKSTSTQFLEDNKAHLITFNLWCKEFNHCNPFKEIYTLGSYTEGDILVSKINYSPEIRYGQIFKLTKDIDLRYNKADSDEKLRYANLQEKYDYYNLGCKYSFTEILKRDNELSLKHNEKSRLDIYDCGDEIVTLNAVLDIPKGTIFKVLRQFIYNIHHILHFDEVEYWDLKFDLVNHVFKSSSDNIPTRDYINKQIYDSQSLTVQFTLPKKHKEIIYLKSPNRKKELKIEKINIKPVESILKIKK